LRFDDAMLKGVGFVFVCEHPVYYSCAEDESHMPTDFRSSYPTRDRYVRLRTSLRSVVCVCYGSNMLHVVIGFSAANISSQCLSCICQVRV